MLVLCGYSQSYTHPSETDKSSTWEPIITDPSDSPLDKSYTIKYTTNKGDKTVLNRVDIPLKIASDRITVYNTTNGKKYWEVNYLGVVKISKYNNFIFHKFYLVNKKVYFYISDQKVFTGPNNVTYYMIDFDGELQFASQN